MRQNVSGFIVHPCLKAKSIEARAYQLQALDESISGSMLLVLPTAAGKTSVAWMAIAERIRKSDGWILFIAPTVALVNQHLENAKANLQELQGNGPISLSGHQIAEKRKSLWPSSRLIFATPQVVRNDVKKGALSLEECSLLVVDEAHHCTGEHAMAEAAECYVSQAKSPLILATTASPGSRKEKIREICDRLGVKRIHLRTSDDPMLSEHLSELGVIETIVAVPDGIRELADPLIIWQESIVDSERRSGRYVLPGPISQRGLSSAMERAQLAIARKDSSGYRSMSQIATAMRLHHMINHLLCQGIAASRQFLKRMRAEQDKSKSAKDFLKDGRISSLEKILEGMDESHSKVGAVRRLVSERMRRDADAKVIVFANYRDTVAVLSGALEGVKGCRVSEFVGQASKWGAEGLSPKQQIERLQNFRSGNSNVLVATSVGEEGLDIPSADLVIFYEPISSEIRTIQRRGRTGRRREGEVIVLIAEGTRDEGARAAAAKRESFMHKSVRRVGRELPRPHHADLSNLSDFSVMEGDSIISAADFVRNERAKHETEINEVDENEIAIYENKEEVVSPTSFRPTGQTGLEEF